MFLSVLIAAVMCCTGIALADAASATVIGSVADDVSDALTTSSDNVGEVLTSKNVTVGDDNSFNVTLSALSSTSNTITTSTTPLDIVLVLDVSGSMDDNMTSYTYTETYSLSTWSSYYVQVDGTYYSVSYSNGGWGQQSGWYYTTGSGYNEQRVYVTAKTSASDTDASHMQFYTRTQASSTKKIDALKSAVNSFIDATAAANASISDESLQHKVAIVKYAGDKTESIGNSTYNDGWYTYNYSQRVQTLMTCTTDTASSLKSTVNSLTAAGATSADYGMQLAQTELNQNKRSDAKQIIIFFTDGEPNHGNDFDGTVANDAISAAGTLKSAKTTIYTIGIFEGASPSGTGNANAYMNAVSSNYPNATSYTNLGTRASDDAAYYKAASSSDELANIFKEIQQEITTGGSLPTKVTSGSESSSGYVTFTDELGEYMRVGDTITVNYGGTAYTATKDADGNYTLSGNVTDSLGNTVSLSNIIITVTKGETHDTVQVGVPGSLLPLDVYETKDGSTTKTTEASPITINYNVSLDTDLVTAENLALNSDLASYVSSNKTDDGNVYFYSNKYAPGDNGTTTATFEPADGNPAYADSKVNETVVKAEGANATSTAKNASSSSVASGTVTTALGNNGRVTVQLPAELDVSKTVSSPKGSNIDNANFSFTLTLEDADGSTLSGTYAAQLYKGTEKQGDQTTVTTGSAFTLKDGETLHIYGLPAGATYTVTEGTMPSGYSQDSKTGDTGTLAANTTSTASFTNKYTASGSLDGATNLVGSKSITSEKSPYTGSLAGFEFSIALADDSEAKDGVTLPANVISDKSGNFAFCDITFTKTGTYKFVVSEVTPDTKAAGISYTDTMQTVYVKVTDNGDGTLTVTRVDASGDAIESGSGALTFTNTYTTTDTPAQTISVTKAVTGKAAEGAFTFTLGTTDEATLNLIKAGGISGVTLDEGATSWSTTKDTSTSIAKGGSETVSFDSMVFTKAGTYTFTVSENQPTTVPTGWTYDKHTCTVTVAVTDTNAQLSAAVSYSTDNGGSTFTNSFGAETTYGATGGLMVTKTLNGRALEADKFSFTIAAAEGDADAAAKLAKLAESDSTQASFTNTAAADGVAAEMQKLGGLAFDEEDVGKTFTYTVTEATGTEMAGYTYDATPTATVAIAVSLNSENEIVTSTTVTKGEQSTTYSGGKTAIVAFTNTYEANGSLEGAANLKVSKTLSGRDWAENETYTFEISAADGTPLPTDTTIELGKPTEGATATGAFGNISYTQTDAGKEYTYNIRETGTSGDANLTYSQAEYQVVVSVADKGDGTMEATVKSFTQVKTDAGDSASTAATGNTAAFTNTYKPTDEHPEKDVAKSTDATTSINGQLVGVGDQLVYTINWENDAIDSAGNAITADVTITDQVPTGTKFVSADNDGVEAGGTVTWTLKDQAANAKGTVNFTVEVTDDAAGKTVTNKATITVGGNEPKISTETENPVPSKTVSGTAEDGSIQVGQELIYSISYKNTELEAATVTITDSVPTGTAYVEGSASDNGVVSEDGTTVTWTLENVAAGAEDTVSFKVKVTEDALEANTVTNQASVKIGENGPEVKTNTTSTEVKTGSAKVSKTVSIPEGLTPSTSTFTIVIALQDASGAELTGSYGYTLYNAGGEPATNEDGTTVTGTIANGGSVGLTGGQYVVIEGLPEGATVTASETAPAGFTATYDPATVTVASTGDPAEAKVVNTYKVAETTLKGSDALTVSKTLNRDSTDGESFTFKIEAANDAAKNAMPSSDTVTISSVSKDKAATASFGDITYTAPGEYKYTVSEVAGSIEGMSYSHTKYTVTVTVTDKGDGTLEAKATYAIGETAVDSMAFANAEQTKTVSDTTSQVGKTLAYTVNYTNNEVTGSTVTITDQVPAGTQVAQVNDGGVMYDADGNETTDVTLAKSIKWTIGGVGAGVSGNVSFQVKVTEDAIDTTIQNSAKVVIGVNGPEINTVPTKTVIGKPGSLSISKTVVATMGTTAPEQDFEFTVELEDAAGETLAGTYSYVKTDADGNALTGEGSTGTIVSGGIITLAHGQTATISGLPEGATYTVAETPAGDNWTAEQTGDTGTITAEAAATAAFINTYKPGATVLSGETNLQVSKTLSGRDWAENEKYTFEISAAEGTPLPETKTVTLGKPDEGATATGAFGDISYSEPGTYEYTITETSTSADNNLTMSGAEYKVVVTVAADGSALKATSVMTQVKDDKGKAVETTVESNTAGFTNTYTKPDQKKAASAESAQAGDTLTYTITWANDAIDATGAAAAASVTVTDTLPTGVTFQSATVDGAAPAEGVLAQDGQTLTFDLGEKAANATGTIVIVVAVDEQATGTLSNAAYVNGVVTNSVSTDVAEPGSLTVTKKIVSEKAPIDENAEFTIQVAAKDANGHNLTGTYATGETSTVTFVDGVATLTLKHGESATISGLPAGASYKVEEVNAPASYNATYDKANEGTIQASGELKTTVTNTYEPGDAEFDPTSTGVAVTKVLNGGTLAAEQFDFTMTVAPKAGTEATADGASPATQTAKNAAGGSVAFGKVTFSHTGTYTVTVAENLPDEWGGTLYDTHTYSYDVVVTAVDGKLVATADASTIAEGEGTFTNVMPTKTVEGVSDDGVKVGDELTYTVTWANTTDAAADVVVSDKLSDGLTYVSTETEGVEAAVDGQTVTWTLEAQEAGATGTITFKALVNESALSVDNLDNTATVRVGDNPAVNTNTVPVTKPATGNLTVSKTVVDGDTNKYFDFTITATDAEEHALNGTYSGVAFTNGIATIQLKSGESQVIDGLPEGAIYTVTETAEAGYTTTSTGDEGTISKTDASIAAFTNTYASTNTAEVTTAGMFSKTLVGRDWLETDAFNFVLTPVDDAASDSAMVDKENAAGFGFDTMYFSFDDIKDAEVQADGSRSKTFIYKVSEQESSIAGITADEHEATLTITVTDDGEGNLSATTEVRGEDFVNTYSAGAADLTIAAEKQLTNRPMTDGEFTFYVYNVSTDGTTKWQVVQGTNAVDGTITFGNISYTTESLNADIAAGKASVVTNEDGSRVFTYTYEVSESSVLPAGVKKLTTEPFTITVTVTDDGQGGDLAVATTYPDGTDHLTFVNTYAEGSSTAVEVEGTKTLAYDPAELAESAKLKQADIAGKYTFTITGSEGAPMPEVTTVTNDADGNVDFGTITYTMANVWGDTGDAIATIAEDGTEAPTSAVRSKTFTYTVTESGNVAGVENDGTATTGQTFTVTVTDNGDGTLSVEKSTETGKDFAFTNTYSVSDQPSSPTGEGNLTLTKELAGRDLLDGEFSFTLTAADGTTVETVTNHEKDENGNISFSEITFSLPGTYTYTVTEAAQDNYGYAVSTYDTAARIIKATVTDNGNGTLSVAWAIDGSSTFANTYTTETTVDTDPTEEGAGFTKLLSGREWTDDDAFTFTLSAAGDPTYTPLPESTTTTVTKADLIGIATDEIDPEMGAGSNSTAAFGFGTITFTQDNMVDATVNTDPETGLPVSRTETFYYYITENVPADSTYSEEEGVWIDSEGNLWDGHTAMLEITITDNLDGTMTVDDVTVSEGNFSNHVYAAGEVDYNAVAGIEVVKTLVGRAMGEGEFSFTLADVTEGSLARLGLTDTVSTPAAAQGEDLTSQSSVSLFNAGSEYSHVVFDLSDAGHTYSFTVAENNTGVGGVTYDETVYQVDIAVTYGDDGLLHVDTTISYASGELAGQVFATSSVTSASTSEGRDDTLRSLPFNNYYEPEPTTPETTNSQLVINKTLSGRTLNEGEFSFAVYEANADGTKAETDPVAVATVNADGVATTSNIVYTSESMSDAATVGTIEREKTFYYVIEEIVPSEESGTKLGGVTYDESQWLATVVVHDDGQGTLSIKSTGYTLLGGDGSVCTTASFTNTYHAATAYYQPQGHKSTYALEGADLSGYDGTFSYVIRDAEGVMVGAGTSSANGYIDFSNVLLPFDEAGDYYYTIVEVNGGTTAGGITFDGTVVEMLVSVVDQYDGTFNVSATYSTGDGANFENVYDGNGITFTPSATKDLTDVSGTGRTLEDGEFSFAVVDEDAAAALEAQGYSAEDARNASIVSTGVNNADGTVTFGSINYSYYKDAADAYIQVPDLTGKTVEEAQAALDELGLTIEVVQGDVATDEASTGLVYATNPAAQTYVGKGSTVKVTVYAAAAGTEATVPELVGMTSDAAVAALTEAGLTASVVEGDAAPTAEQAGLVYATDPASGTTAAQGSTVTVTVYGAYVEPSTEPSEPTVDPTEPTEPENPGQDSGTTTEPTDTETPAEPSTDETTDTAATTEEQAAEPAAEALVEEPVAETSLIDVAVETFGATEAIADDTDVAPYTIDEPVVVSEPVEGADSTDSTTVELPEVSTDLGDHHYTVYEVEGTLGGVTYDKAVYSMTVTVTDNGDGTIKAEVTELNRTAADGSVTPITISGENGMANVAFYNSYKADTPATVTFEGQKTLVGRDANEGEFGFVVSYVAEDGTVTPATAGVSTAAASGVAAGIQFGTLTFSETGTYTFRITEAKGGTVEDGVTYDSANYTAVVTVTDNYDGSLSATVEYPDGSPTFTNVYAPSAGEASTVIATATKTLTGRDMKAGEFTFALKNDKGNTVGTAVNTADGTVTFPGVRFSKTGVYEFTISEVAGNESGMTYDSSVYRMVVTVTDDLEGNYVATVEYPDGTPTFANTYVEPAKPVTPTNPTSGGSTIPKTDDETPNAVGLAGAAAAGAAAIAAGAAVLVRSRKRGDETQV